MLLTSHDARHSVMSLLPIAQSNAVIWRKAVKIFPMCPILESSEGSWYKYHRRMLRNLYKVPL